MLNCKCKFCNAYGCYDHVISYLLQGSCLNRTQREEKCDSKYSLYTKYIAMPAEYSSDLKR